MQKRTIDLLTESYKDQMTARRKYEFKDANGVVKANLYFKPLTRMIVFALKLPQIQMML